MHRIAITIGLTLPLTAAAVPLAAQSVGDAVAYATLVTTPPGALPPTLSKAMLNWANTSPEFGLRYGRLSGDGESLNNFAAGLRAPVSTRASLNFTAGYLSESCDGCSGHLMLGAGGEGRLASVPLGAAQDGATLTLGLAGELGYGKPSGGYFLTSTAGVPMALVADFGSVKLAPFVQPAFGYGRASGGGSSQDGTRFLLGGGMALVNTSIGLGLNVGFQKVFIQGGKTTFGVSLAFSEAP